MQHTRASRLASFGMGLAAVAVALTPSLVPRPAMFQGFLAGLIFGLSYLATSWLWRYTAFRSARRRRRAFPARPADTSANEPVTATPLPRWAWVVAAVVLAGYVVWLGALTITWQNDVRSLVEMPPVDGVEALTFFAVAFVVGAIVFGTHRGLKKMAALGRGWTRRAVPAAASRTNLAVLGGVLTGVLTAAIAVALIVTLALLGTDFVYSARNNSTPTGITEPASTFRSAGTGSAVDWDSLGQQGRIFIGGGPTADQIQEATHRPALTPVRVYVGVAQEDSVEDRAQLAVAELKRTGGFTRSTLVIATPTGSGWLERQAVDSLEYLQGGDSAIVSMQYSYQPSWVPFLFGQDLPRKSAQALYKAVRAEWDALPETDRPALFVYGLSLGALGMQSAFSSVDDLTSSVDGAVFSGAPNNSQPWGTLQAGRDSGSSVWQPVFENGQHIRWLSKSGDFDRLTSEWAPARIAYLQHGTDAVTWLTPTLIWQKPDWLKGSAADGGRAPDVSDSMHWVPLVTWVQVVFDMFMGEAVPASHGHNFGDVAVAAWNGVHPSGLDGAAVDRIQDIIARYPFEDAMKN